MIKEYTCSYRVTLSLAEVMDVGVRASWGIDVGESKEKNIDNFPNLRCEQLDRVSHFNPRGIALTAFYLA